MVKLLDKPLALLFWQIAWLASCGVMAKFFGYLAIKACFIASIVVTIPQIVFIALYFCYQGAIDAKKIVNLFYLAEALKLILTFGLIFLCFSLTSFNVSWFLFSYIGALLAYFWAPVILKEKF